MWYWCLSAFNAAGLLSAFTLSLSLPQRRPAELCSPTIISTMITCFNSTVLHSLMGRSSSTWVCLMTAAGLLLANESVRGMFSGRWQSYTFHVLDCWLFSRFLERRDRQQCFEHKQKLHRNWSALLASRVHPLSCSPLVVWILIRGWLSTTIFPGTSSLASCLVSSHGKHEKQGNVARLRVSVCVSRCLSPSVSLPPSLTTHHTFLFPNVSLHSVARYIN